MKHLTIAFATISVFALAGCDRPKASGETPDFTSTSADAPASAMTPATPVDEPATATTPPVGEQAPAPEGGARGSSGDDIALGLLATVDENEIAAAKQAQEKKVTGAVLDYAKMMETEHGENLAQTKALGTLGETPDVKVVKDKGAKDLDMLGQKSGKEYEAAYVDAMIAGHKDALALIDGKMMSAVSTDPVRTHLTETRKHVAMHLAKAEEIKGKM